MMEIKKYKTIFDKYEFLSKLDKISGNEDICGNMSTVYVLSEVTAKAEELESHLFICKRVRGDKYYENEWKLVDKIHSKGENDRIIQFVDIYYRSKEESTFYDYYYLISPFKGEQDLFSFIMDIENPKLPEKLLKQYLLEMALCVKVCHDNCIVHLDLKTENFVVMSEKPFRLKLIDFGFSNILSSPKDNIKLKRILGTPFYVAPEIDNDKTCYLASDVFSLGAIMIFLVNTTDSSDDLSEQIKQFKRMDYYSEPFKKLVLKMLSKKPKKRITINGVIDTLNELDEKRIIIT